MRFQAIRVAVLSAVLLASFTVFVSAAKRPGKHYNLTSKEVKALIANAKTPEDHLKLAAYYREEARKLEASAKNHADMANMYKQEPAETGESGGLNFSRTSGVQHCQSIADNERKAAEDANSMAQEHEKFAAQLREKK